MYLEKSYSPVEQKFFDEISVQISALPVQIYDIEYIAGSKTLRLFIIDDATNSATIEDCISVDRGLSDYFESSEWITDEIVLEVSSPGIFRGLFKKDDFEKALNSPIKCEFKAKISSEMFDVTDTKVLNQKKIIGTLKTYDEQSLGVEFFEKQYEISYELLKKVNIESN